MNYQIVLANSEQMESIFNRHWTDPNVRQKVKDDTKFILIAIDENKNLIGRIRVKEKSLPPPLKGIGWWIINITTNNPHRRTGIGTAMLNALEKHAEQQSIQYLFGSAEATEHATMFWYKNNFSMQKYTQQCGDKNKPDEYGNWAHMIFRRLNKCAEIHKSKQKQHRIIRANSEHLDWIYNEHVKNESTPKYEYYQANKSDFFGFVAVDEDGKISGIITALADEWGCPLIGKAWAVSYVFVRPDLRRQGIGSALINEIVNAAKQANVEQVLFVAMYEQVAEFLDANDLDLFFWRHLSESNSFISAGLRIL